MITLPRFSQARILVVGDIMLDRSWHGETKRISPEAPVPIVNINQMRDQPGGAGNVSHNIAALGGHVFLSGFVGKDEAAALLKKQLNAKNIATHFVDDDAITTITKLRIISHHQQLIRLDFEKNFCDPALNIRLFNEIEPLYDAVDLILFSDYAKGTLSDVQRYIELAYQRGIKTLVDPKGSDFSKYRHATLVTPNMNEFTQIVGACRNEAEISEKGYKLLNEYGWEALLITRSEEGMTLLQKDLPPLHLPTQAREVYDVTGAGDTVIAVLAAALAAGANFSDATKLANIAAGIVVGKLGTATVSALELRDALRKTGKHAEANLSLEQMILLVEEAKKEGQKIVFTNGCFDILHAGHVQYLEEAKLLGHKLIVGVNSDASVKRLKGASRPINTLSARMRVLSGLAAVDWVVAFDEDTPENLIQGIAPDVLVKGGDYQIEQIVGADFVLKNGGCVKVLSFTEGYSTSKTIEKVRL